MKMSVCFQGEGSSFPKFLKQKFCRLGGTFALQKKMLATNILELKEAQP